MWHFHIFVYYTLNSAAECNIYIHIWHHLLLLKFTPKVMFAIDEWNSTTFPVESLWFLFDGLSNMLKFTANTYLSQIYISFLYLLGKYTPQYKWLEQELPKVNRTETPWLIVLMHSPWYNSYNYHYMEGETMRVMYEPWFVQYKVDVVFAGHVHAYERSVSTSHKSIFIK